MVVTINIVDNPRSFKKLSHGLPLLHIFLWQETLSYKLFNYDACTWLVNGINYLLTNCESNPTSGWLKRTYVHMYVLINSIFWHLLFYLVFQFYSSCGQQWKNWIYYSVSVLQSRKLIIGLKKDYLRNQKPQVSPTCIL